jgi:hypothetical protein
MPLYLDTLLGTAYLAPQDFIDRADYFGAQTSIAGKSAEQLQALAAQASRAIEAKCGRSFTPDAITETHPWNAATRRVRVLQSPVLSLESFTIRTALDNEVEIDTDKVAINNARNFLEVTPAGLAEFSGGSADDTTLREAEVVVVYQSYDSIPPKVIAACGFTMAKMANEAYASGQVPDGFTRVKMGNMDIMRRNTTDDTDLLPPIAKDLLREFDPPSLT